MADTETAIELHQQQLGGLGQTVSLEWWSGSCLMRRVKLWTTSTWLETSYSHRWSIFGFMCLKRLGVMGARPFVAQALQEELIYKINSLDARHGIRATGFRVGVNWPVAANVVSFQAKATWLSACGFGLSCQA